MPTSQARIEANQANALKSTGPKIEEGKARSRANAVKHGLTGAGAVLPEEEAGEVDRLQQSFESELKPSGDLGRTLLRRMALMAVRMDRCVAQETAALTLHVEQALADFDEDVPAEDGVDDPAREQVRAEVARIALFDPSKEATLARKYEAAAERCFFRSLKEFRLVEKQAKAEAALGSFSPVASKPASPPAEAPPKAAPRPVEPISVPPKPVGTLPEAPKPIPRPSIDVPFAIGRAG